MNRVTLIGAMVCGLLGVVIAAELAFDISIPPPAPAQSGARAAAPGNEVASAVTVDDDVRAIEARPLFSRDRRPVKSDATAAKPTAAATAFKRRLTGVVIQQDKRAAIFSGDGKGRGIVVAEGAQIEGWFVETVTAVNVTLRSATQSQVLELVRSKTNAAPAPALAPATLSFIPEFLRNASDDPSAPPPFASQLPSLLPKP